LRLEVLKKYGGACRCCGEQAYEFLCVMKRGGRDTPRKNNGEHTSLLYILRREKVSRDYQILCRNCNQSIGYYGGCPHRKRLARSRTPSQSRWAQRYNSMRDSVLRLYGGACACCGEAKREFLAIDHVRGNGRAERSVLDAERMLSKLLAMPVHPDYRILCHNCNSSIYYYGYCPHQKSES
jgi:hypothetical protein